VTVDGEQKGVWLTLREASAHLGISEKTARRRVKLGTLTGRQVPTQHGPTWQVWVPEGVDTQGRVDSTGTQAATMLELVRLVGELQPKAEAAAMWQARAELLAHQLDAAQQTIRALQAPEPPETPIASNPGPIGEKPPREPSEPSSPAPMPPTPDGSGRAPWWRRWAAWL
jgi:hypothetical protein